MDSRFARMPAAHDGYTPSGSLAAASNSLSVGFMGVAATAIASLLNRYPWIAYAGTAIIAYVAVVMIWDGSMEIMKAVS